MFQRDTFQNDSFQLEEIVIRQEDIEAYKYMDVTISGSITEEYDAEV